MTMQFLRKVQQGRWQNHLEVDWLEEGELQGDALTDVPTTRGKISVYRINDRNDWRRVITALAATRDSIAHLDYALFEDVKLDLLGISIKPTYGATPDNTANKLHYELGNLSTRRLVKLTEIIADGEHCRISKKQIEKWLQDAINNSHLDVVNVRPSIPSVSE